MSCERFDWKAYVLGEHSGGETGLHEAHLKDCAACRDEVAGLKVTVTALKRLPKMEPPRRIAFVSDPVVEPSWWARLWASGPRLGFASAAMLSLAILGHGMMARTSGGDGIEARVDQELARRLPAAVEQAAAANANRQAAELKPAMAEIRTRLDGLERNGMDKMRAELDERRKSDLQEIRAAFDLMERRITTRYLSAARYEGN
jgi:anti-sigma factor RsiW